MTALARLRQLLEGLAAQPPAQPCPDPIECGHQAALGQAEEQLRRVREVADTWFTQGEPGPTQAAGKHLLRVLNTPVQPGPAATGPDTRWQPDETLDYGQLPPPATSPGTLLRTGASLDQPAPVVPRDPCPRCEGSPTLIPRHAMTDHTRVHHPEETPS